MAPAIDAKDQPGHRSQAGAVVVAEKVPAEQSVQIVFAAPPQAAAWYVPAAHTRHV